MTVERRDKGDTPASAWIRSQPELDSRKGYDLENIDHIQSIYLWNQFYQAKLMLIEEKCYYRDATPAQKDTFGVFNQACRYAFGDPEFRVKRHFPNRPDKYTYYGYHLVQFECTSPLDGGIRIDYKQVTEEEYLRFLQFDPHIIEEKLRFYPLMVSVDDYFPKPRRRVRKSNLPTVATLFNPISQQELFGEVFV